MNKLSVVLATYNEAENLARCLDSVSDLSWEIIVVDGSSTDKTREVAEKYKARVFIRDNPANFHINKKLAIEKASGDWILQMDADEMVTPELKSEILTTITSDTARDGYWIPRKNYFLGTFLTKGGAYPDYTLRLYKRGKGSLPAKSVHEQATVVGQTAYLSHPLLHYSNRTFSEYLERRFNRYTDLMAVNIKGGFWENVFIRPLFDPNQGFLSIYFRHLGLLDGFPGFVWAVFSGLHFPIAYFKKMSGEKDKV